MISKLQVSRMQLSRLESRLSNIFETLKNDETRSAYDLVGDSLEELCTLKKKVQTEEDMLSNKGLRRVSESYSFYAGETVVIVADGEWKGFDAIVKAVDVDTVTVVPIPDYFFSISDEFEKESIVLRRRDVAIFDNPDWGFSNSVDVGTKLSSSRRGLSSGVLGALSTLNTSKNTATTSPYKVKEESNPFTSARQRKASTAAAKQKVKQTKGNKKR